MLWILVAGSFVLGLEGCASKTPRAEEPLTGSPVTVTTPSSNFSEDPNSRLKDKVSPNGLAYDPFEQTEAPELKEYDPWEPFNLVMFDFNYKFDRYLLKPIATGYNYVLPDDLQKSIYNVFQNLGYAPRFLNNVFQGKFKGASIETGRFLINTTLGVGGLFDPATLLFDLETPVEDFGQTLGAYGTNPGPYLVIPFLGPYTLRDAFGYVVDIFLNPVNWFIFPIIKTDAIPQLVTDDLDIALAQFGLRAWNILNLRSLTLERFADVEEGTIDLYGAVRNAYLQNRAKAIRE